MSITVLQDKQGLEDEQGDKEIRVLRIYITVQWGSCRPKSEETEAAAETNERGRHCLYQCGDLSVQPNCESYICH